MKEYKKRKTCKKKPSVRGRDLINRQLPVSTLQVLNRGNAAGDWGNWMGYEVGQILQRKDLYYQTITERLSESLSKKREIPEGESPPCYTDSWPLPLGTN
jgi:hypothetical protein